MPSTDAQLPLARIGIPPGLYEELDLNRPVRVLFAQADRLLLR